MRLISRENFASVTAVGVCLTALGVLAFSYDVAWPTALAAQDQPKEAPKQTTPVPPPAATKQQEPRRFDPPTPPRPFPDFGGKRFGKKTRDTTLSERLGIRTAPPGDDLTAMLGLPEGEGLSVFDVRDGSVAANAGMKVGDVLVELGARNVPSDPMQFDFKLGDLKAGEPVDAVIVRDGKMETLKGLLLPAPLPRPLLQFKGKRPPIE